MSLPSRAIGRAVYLACTLCALAGLLLAGRSLWGVIAEPEEAYPVEEIAISAARSGSGAEEDGQGRPEPATWPPLFGKPVPEPPTAAPSARMPADYVLKGLMTSGALQWAILSGGGDDQLVQEGDILTAGVEVESIRPEGVWLRFGDLRELVAFSDAAQVQIASVEVGSGDGETGLPPRRQEVRTQSLTPTQLRDLILKSEADRLARGLVPQKPDAPQVEDSR